MHFTIEDPICPLSCTVVPAGPDSTIVIAGGDAPHVGCIVLAEARPSLAGEGMSATVSRINRLGHLDDAVAAAVAKAVASATGGACACTCGIHLDNAAPAAVAHIKTLSARIAERAIEALAQTSAPAAAALG